jgi:hypothetical protein
MVNHPWKLTGPWYRGDSIGGVPGGRHSAPIFQKYAASDFANRIVEEPQRSLKFVSEDFANRLTYDPNHVITRALRQQNPEQLKLFLDLHSRFYIVVCALHCDVAGFPMAKRDQVCEAGFVVRRRFLQVPGEVKKRLGEVIRERGELKAQILKSVNNENKFSKDPTTFGQLVGHQSEKIRKQFKSAKLIKLQQRFALNSSTLENLIEDYQIKRELQGWKPADLKGVGNWVTVDETPLTLYEEELPPTVDEEEPRPMLREEVYPLYPIIADPTDKEHSAKGQTLWFGVVPTSSGDSTSGGNVKLDDNSAFHVRCFVRRHKTHCPKKNNESDCSGELVWSDPSETYQLASAYDLDGASHRPINITMPDLAALKKQADLGPPGRGVGAKVITPENSTPVFNTKMMDLPEVGDPETRPNAQFCFYFSLLFFLVAMFLFRLILPIFMFLFQLWFLLKLKFCIPPSFELSADLKLDLEVDFSLEVEVDFDVKMAAELAVKGPDLEAKFAADASFSVDIGGVSYTNANKNDLKNLLAKMISEETGVSGEEGTEEKSLKSEIESEMKKLSLDELAETYINQKTQYQDDAPPELAGELPTPEKGLHYFKKVFAS